MKQELHFRIPIGTMVRRTGQDRVGRVIGYTYDPNFVDSSTDLPNVYLLVKEPWGPIHIWIEDNVVLEEDLES